ncbi:MAG: biopolymer transporter ExbD [Verrucomicrobia bacterium]|nr:biopolymer transporter ExbD [Verrucomicrobiota bacterium]
MQFPRPAKKTTNVPIIPMIDVLFVLLIFVVVSTNFKRPRHTMQITLPVAKDVPTEKVVGEMSVLAVDGKGMLMLEGAGVPEGLLDSYLQAWRKINPSRKLEIEADEKAPFGKMVEVWGALNRLGIEVMPTRARLSEPAPTP